MKKVILLLIAVCFTVACEDDTTQFLNTNLTVENTGGAGPGQADKGGPDDATLASSSEAVEATAEGLYNAWYNATQGYETPFSSMQMMADVGSCSWGNAGMGDTSSEPRLAWNNSVGYGNERFTNNMFNSLYAINTDANSIVSGVTDNPDDYSDANGILAIARFHQALTVGYLALVFDRVWLSDENGAIGDEAVGYKEAMEFALAKLDQAIALTSTDSELYNTYGARLLIYNARNSSDKSATDWNRALAYAQNGLTSDFNVESNYAGGQFQNDHKWVAVQPGWARIDLRVINMMDSSYPDYWPANTSILDPAQSADARLALDFDYLSGQNFRPERGEYHYSSYRYQKYDDWLTDGQAGPLEEASVHENDLYKAEALLALGDVGGAAAIINASLRTTRGGLDNITASPDAVKAAIHYERVVEMPLLSAGLAFFEMRKENLLQAGTLLHFPVPGKALESGQFAPYTFGGTTGVAGQDYSAGGWR